MDEFWYSKFVKFLREQELYEEKSFNYIMNKAFFVDFTNEPVDNLKVGCTLIFSQAPKTFELSDRLRSFFPVMPVLNSETAVSICIYVYVQALLLVERVEKRIIDDSYNEILPLFYQKLYIVRNYNEELATYDKYLEQRLLESAPDKNRKLLKGRKDLIKFYKYASQDTKKLSRKAKRIAKECIRKDTLK